MIRRMIRSAGFDVVRVPVPRAPAPPSAAPDGGRPVPPGESIDCYPGDPTFAPFNPWPIPRDLAALTAPWARTLATLYRARGSWPACVSPEAGMFIHALVRNIRPRTVVETGTCHGASTIWIASALSAAHEDAPPGTPRPTIHTFDDFSLPSNPDIAGLDLYARREGLVRERLETAGIAEFVRIHKGDSSSSILAARAELDRAGGVQLAFIDGDHTAEGARRDFAAVEPSLNVGGFILLHDVWPTICGCTGPRWLADNINEIGRGRYQVCDLYTAPLNYGLTILRRTA
jgi:predicted O-methyltransferase YrrM